VYLSKKTDLPLEDRKQSVERNSEMEILRKRRIDEKRKHEIDKHKCRNRRD
jgi:hypothetical protein